MAKKTKKNKNPIQWYITTCSNGNEDTVIKNLKAKVSAMHFEEMIFDAKVIKIRTVEEEIFDDNDPNKIPPKNMRNSSTIKWKTLGNGKYLKTKIIDRNKFPGYIYVKMIMNDDAWYAVRNAQNITGLVGSSGKGAKPIPITFEEEMLLSGESENPEVRVVVLPNAIIEMERTKFNDKGEPIGFEELEPSKEHLNEENNDFDKLENIKTTDKPFKNKSSKKESKSKISDQKEEIQSENKKVEIFHNLPEETEEIQNAETIKSKDEDFNSEEQKDLVPEKNDIKHEEPEVIEEAIDNNLNEKTPEIKTTEATDVLDQEFNAEQEKNLNIVDNNDQADQAELELKDSDASPSVKEANSNSNKYDLSAALENINDVSKLLPTSDFSEKESLNSSVDQVNYATKEDPYKVGHFVEIILGEHSGIQGNIVEINREQNKVSVQVEIMGKETILVLDYNQITLKK